MDKDSLIKLGILYIQKYNCYPAAKGWKIATAGCSRDEIYKIYSSWILFVEELKQHIAIPNNGCATYPNGRSNKNIETDYLVKDKECIVCQKLTFSKNTFCSTACSSAFKQKAIIADFEQGLYQGKHVHTGKDTWLRNYLITKLGYTCSACGIGDTYNNKSITLEVDHINGRCYDNILSNLRFLCPNCHSQTDTYKAKNTSSDRVTRYK